MGRIVDLYAREADGFVEVAMADVDGEGRPTWLKHDRLRGSLADLHLDQRGTPIPWEVVEPPQIENPISDMLQARTGHGHEDSIAFLHVELGNAINAAGAEPSFARRARELMVGSWKSAGTSIRFSRDRTYSIERIDADLVLSMAPSVGRWSLSSNRLYLMGDQRGAGDQLVDVDSKVMVLSGFAGARRYVLERDRLH
jgi:hypothetical protein